MLFAFYGCEISPKETGSVWQHCTKEHGVDVHEAQEWRKLRNTDLFNL
jgi:hypothetical protein